MLVRLVLGFCLLFQQHTHLSPFTALSHICICFPAFGGPYTDPHLHSKSTDTLHMVQLES